MPTIAAALAFAGCAEPPSLPHVVLISIDTLRADHLPMYGYPRDTAPRLSAFAESAIVFERAYSASSQTLSSHASLLTGLPPSRHGLIRVIHVLPRDVTTLAAILRERGYRTGAFLNGEFLHPKFQLNRGFETYDYPDPRPAPTGAGTAVMRSAEQTNRAIFEWLDGAPESGSGDRPVLLFAHYFDVHSARGPLPYEAPPPYLERFAKQAPSDDPLSMGPAGASTRMLALNHQGVALPDETVDWMRSLYDAGIAYTDFHVGALLDGLEQRGMLERAIVIVTSDHGEEFQEHGRLLHEQVYEELVRVPLLMSLPSAADVLPAGRPDWPEPGSLRGARIGAVVRHVDLFPTVLDAIGLAPPAPISGRSLRPLLQGSDPSLRVAHARNALGSQRTVIGNRWKLVIDPAAGPPQLFDLLHDPLEQRDVAAERPEQVERMLARDEGHRARWGGERATADSEPGEFLKERLRALGYVVDE